MIGIKKMYCKDCVQCQKEIAKMKRALTKASDQNLYQYMHHGDRRLNNECSDDYKLYKDDSVRLEEPGPKLSKSSIMTENDTSQNHSTQ